MMKEPQYISHLRQEGDGRWVFQSNEEHSAGVAKLAGDFAADFGMRTWGEVLGLLHDKGKERKSFQQYIRRESGYEPSLRQAGEHYHSFVGAAIAREKFGKSADIFITNPILSHHTGLRDVYAISRDIEKGIPSDVDAATPSLPALKGIQLAAAPAAEDFHHIARQLFSCLVDADRLDTERFMNPDAAAIRGGKATLADLLPKLNDYLEKLAAKASETEVNRIRQQVQQRCAETATMVQGVYSLTVPTGGGKTLSSLVWAMRHAVQHGLRRVIIAIPYTSIIVQTAEILRKIFGEENVLEHHSAVDADSMDDEQRLKWESATENWDYPIVVTTNVQLFESMISNRASDCRKLHNITKSVIILDEAQTLPTQYLAVIVATLRTYQKLFHVSILLTTASQPVLTGDIEGSQDVVKGLDTVSEIIPTDYQLHDRLRRVRLEIDYNAHTYDEVAELLMAHKRVLCIVNTRRDARELFSRLPKEGVTLHLSKTMCAEHIRQTIGKVKEALADEREEVIRVVATQLVEAGVDIDFPVVFRQEAGLDSVLQAAGRCNREGRLPISTTHVFSLAKEHNLPDGDITHANNARRALPSGSDWFSPETMKLYFHQLYSQKENFDKDEVNKGLCHNPKNDYILFETAAKNFHYIDDLSKTVFVKWGEGEALIEALKQNHDYGLMKRLSRYGVNVSQWELDKLRAMGVVEKLQNEQNEMLVVAYASQYDPDVGLMTDNQWLDKNQVI